MLLSSWRLGFGLVAGLAGAWVVGCSDDETAAGPSAVPNDGGAPDVATNAPPPPPSEGGPPPGVNCDDKDKNGLWKHLECSGLYASIADKTLAEGVKAYKPANEFWSDGAEKSRFVFIPPGQKIDVSDFDEWQFPAGTKFWKEFKLKGKRIETRIFVKQEDQSWLRTSYRWTDDESDAVGNNAGESLAGLGPDGGTYEIPRNDQCNECHQGRKDQILGFDAVGMGLPAATGETLAQLATDGFLSEAPPATSFDIPEDATGKARAAIGWVNANCGGCHNGNSNAAANFRAHYLVKGSQLVAGADVTDLDIWKEAYCKLSSRTDPVDGGPIDYIRGGKPSESMMWILSGRRVAESEEPNNTVQMPPLVTRAVDQVGHGKLDAWIAALPACP